MKEAMLPLWIWHPERSEKTSFALRKRFVLERDAVGASCHIALTGAVQVELDGARIWQQPERPRNASQFTAVGGLPETLPAGRHELVFRISCEQAMPIEPINIHLQQRRVGCIAYLQGAGLWIPTDGTWEADDACADIVCLWGEEPYGNLENSPAWFVRGGFGDIAAVPLLHGQVIGAAHALFENRSGAMRVKGSFASDFALTAVRCEQLDLFSILRKEREWFHHNGVFKKMDVSRTPRIRVDLGKEYNARFRVVNKRAAPLTIVWKGAESLYELEHYEGCITEWFEVAAEGEFTVLPLGMRYVECYIFCPAGTEFDLLLVFEEVGVLLKQTGFLETNHPLMNKIYQTGAHTSKVCHQIGLWDGIKRDRLNWVYDFYMAAKADYVLWDDLAVLRRSIRELARTPYGHWMNSLPAYTFWWIMNLWEYLLYTGDESFIREMKDDLVRHLSWIEANLDPDTGWLRDRHQAFIEWVPMDEADSWISLHALIKLACTDLQKIAHFMPELELKPQWKLPQIAEESFVRAKSLITPLLGIMSGYVSDSAARKFLEQYRLADPLTPLSAFWLAECCSRTGMHEKAWEVISRVWGKMLDADGTTFWESIVLDPASNYHDAQTTYTAYGSYRMSLCHSWSSSPVQWISKYVMGVIPTAPGYASMEFAPHAVGGLTRCIGAVPTPQGIVQVDWFTDKDGKMRKKASVNERSAVESPAPTH